MRREKPPGPQEASPRSMVGNKHASPLYIVSRKNFKNESYTPKGHVLIK